MRCTGAAFVTDVWRNSPAASRSQRSEDRGLLNAGDELDTGDEAPPLAAGNRPGVTASLCYSHQFGHILGKRVSKPDKKGAAAKIVVWSIAADRVPFMIVGRPAFLENLVREM